MRESWIVCLFVCLPEFSVSFVGADTTWAHTVIQLRKVYTKSHGLVTKGSEIVSGNDFRKMVQRCPWELIF